ncbi:N-acetyltransferase ESCO2-like [Saccostrea echinata]|uniref:N-acetyltransferase ESCO2-like n=1 Tax=Saccostrea echinata TaxID=191078 RepID=UPI002A7FD79E|nr:N-acetyltransferase ESCO2-like [Saccostrea echinata]
MSMETRTRMTRKRKPADLQENKSSSLYNFDGVENTPPKRKKMVGKDFEYNMESSQSDSEETIATKSFYGKREKKSFPHSPKRRRAANKVLQKLSDEENISQEGSQTSGSESEVNRGHKKVLRKRADKEANAVKPPIKKPNPLKTDSPQTPKAQIKTDTSTTPSSGEKRFFKSRCPGSAEKFIPGVVIRKGFDIKFTPNRRDIVLGKQKKGNEKPKSKKSPLPLTPFPKGKIQNLQKFRSKNNVKHSYPLASNQKVSSQEIENSRVKEDEHLNQGSEESCSPRSLSSEQSVAASIHSGPSIRVRPGSQSTEPADQSQEPGSDVDTTSSVTTEDKMSLITEDTSSVTDTNSEVMEGIQPIVEMEESHDSTPKKQNEENKGTMKTAKGDSTESPSTSTSSPQQKYFPIFNKVTPSPKSRLQTLRETKSRSNSRSPKLKFIENKDDQMTLDAGQKKFGATQCETCGMVYSQAEPTDETTHAKFHQSIINAMKFPGWKKERVVHEYDDGSRVIMVTYDDPKYAIRKVEEINKIMGTELGFPDTTFIFRPDCKVFLMISDEKKISGCCVAENITQGYPVIADSRSSSQESGSRPWYCDTEPEPASVGISKIWVQKLNRKKGVASRLLDCVREHFHYGMYISKKQVAFSDPTPDGKKLATKYTGRSSFLVYKYG